MNDLEHDLRTLLEDKAARAGAPEPSPRLLRRARRRQVGTVVGGLLVAAAIVAGAIVVAALAPADRHTPGSSEPLIDTTVNGITITHPESWYVVDPVEAGIEPADRDLPHLVLFVSDTDPMAAGTLGCPGRGDGATDGFVLTLQEEALALSEEAARGWPVELAPMDVGTSGSACYPGWAFLRASWTASGRTLEARVGMGPDLSEADREALENAYASMRFAPTEGGAGSVVLATGTAGGEDWELIAERQSGGFALSLGWSSGGAGSGGFEDVPDVVQLSATTLGEGDEREIVVFGATRAPVVRLEAFPVLGGTAVSAPVIDVPAAIGGELDAFVLVYRPDLPQLGANLNAYDADGHVLTTVYVHPDSGSGGVAVDPLTPSTIANGDIDRHRWWLLDVGRELQLTEDTRGDFAGDLGSGADLTILMTAERTPEPVLSFGAYTFDDGSGETATFVFGVVSEDTSWVIFSGTDGQVMSETTELGDGLRAYWLTLHPGGVVGQVAAVDAGCSVLQAIQLGTGEPPTAIAQPICPRPLVEPTGA